MRREEAWIERRRERVPVIRYPSDLPVVAHRDELLEAIGTHQVVVVAGETGSGKSTQLPKLCLELGRGVSGMIGHTQPRRLAARTIAERVAEELDSEVGATVGYAVRFTDKVSDDTLVKVMTDGLLLAEIRRDRLLEAYDTIIVDEAHERSLTIDFLLGYVKRILPRRPDLRVIITSATIDTERFAEHFGGARVVEVSGRSHPVEVRYRPIGEDPDDERDQVQAVCDGVVELLASQPSGDVLVFLSGEREIRDTADAVAALDLPDTEVLPLYARLSMADQHRVFSSHVGRRVVLATNVAETSVTVPGVTAVVDAGTARISRYNRRTKVQRLPIEPVSQASASQRAGRCGRIAPGICIRLYSEEDFEARPAFTEPEIRRTNLASVILQMASLGLGDIAAFPFLDPPDARQIRDGILVLEELGALDRDGLGHDGGLRLTKLGRRLAQVPVDPRLGRMVLEAGTRGCLREVLVIAAALSIQDPRERPTGKEQAAAEMHRRFADPDSDFVTLLNLWEHIESRRRELSSGQLRRLCRAEFLNHLRIREWQDVHSQLVQVTRGMGMRRGERQAELDRNGLHLALLTGLLSQIGTYDPQHQDYAGARASRFTIGRGSVLAGKKARWVMAAELVEVGGRSWARMAARIRPDRIEEVAAHLVTRSHGEPFWDERQGAAIVHERVMLYGLPIVTGRRVQWSRFDPEAARELFLQHALVEGAWHGRHAFVQHNAELVAEVTRLGERARRVDLLAGDAALLAFFDHAIPPTVVSAATFDRWWRDERHKRPDLLTFTTDLLTGGTPVRPEDVPDTWVAGDTELALHYRFSPGAIDDGVTVDVPLTMLGALAPAPFEWHVPAMRPAVVAGLIGTLPKTVRRRYVPVADVVEEVLRARGPQDGPISEVVARELERIGRVPVPEGLPSVGLLPDHLRITFRVLSASGREVRRSKDLRELQHQLLRQTIAAIAEIRPSVEVTGLRSWTIGTLPSEVEATFDGEGAIGYPALVDRGTSVAVVIQRTRDDQAAAMAAGTTRLLLLGFDGVAILREGLDDVARAQLALSTTADPEDLLADCATAVVDWIVHESGGPAWDEEDFTRLSDAVALRFRADGSAVTGDVAAIVEQGRWLAELLDEPVPTECEGAIEDLWRQWHRLLGPSFVRSTGPHRLGRLALALEGMEERLASLPAALARDRQLQRQVGQLEARYDRAARFDRDGTVRWMLEDLRIALLAPGLAARTRTTVGEQDVRRALDRLRP